MNNKKFPIGALVLLLVAVVLAFSVLSLPHNQSNPSTSDNPNAASAQAAATFGNESSIGDSATKVADTPAQPVGSAPLPPNSFSGSTASTSGPSGGSIPASGNVRSMVLPPPTSSAGSSGPAGSSTSTSVVGPTSGVSPSSSIYRTPVEILAGKDLSDPEQRAIAASEMTDAEEARYAAVLAKAQQMGIPIRIEGPAHNVQILYDIREEGPLYRKTLNTNAAISTGANLLNKTPYGLNGEGMTVGVWDAARAMTNHVELVGKVTVGDSTTGNDDHSTHVAGTIAAKGKDPKAKGMGTNTLIRTYDWNNDYSEMTAIGAATAAQGATKLPISNHSYGYNATAADMGRYETECNTVDALAKGLPYYLVFWAAGNEQDTLNTVGNGYQSITFNGLAKNIMTVGAADDAVTSGIRDVSKGTLAYFSSMGPCDDGRIKPDIVANGVNVYSCVATTTNSYDGTYSGTSMATPNAAGTAALLVQLYKTNFSGQLMRASMLKALMIHTADDVGRPGPDYQYGWGYMNGKAAADVILSHKASLNAPKMIDDSISNANKVRTTSFVWDGTSPIRATLVWTDVEGVAQTATNSRTRNLINDLDLKITAPNGTTTYLPYVMPFVGTWTTNSMTNNAVTGTNKVDNVERVDIPAPTQAGTYTVTVGMYGANALSGTSQAYSLIVTGGQNVEANPPPVVNITAPAGGAAVLPGTPVTITATATDLAVGGQPGQVTKVEFFEDSTLLGEDTSAPYQWSWTPSGTGARVLTAKATDTENASTVSSPVSVMVLVGDGRPTITSFSPTGGVTGDSVVISGNNLGIASGVQFGALAAAFTANNASQITATVPASAVSAPITVSNSYGTATTTNNFNILPILFREDFSSITGGNNISSGGSSTAWAGNTNFPTGVNDYEAGGAVKLGSSKAAGSITSRAINLAGNGGAFNLSFKVKGWTTVEGQIKITAGTQSQTVSYTATMGGEFETKVLKFTGGTSATTIKIETTAKRAFIDDVVIAAEAPSLPPVITSATSKGGVVGQFFTYQITASNSPTSFGAANLPPGISINTTNGLVSGTPTLAGTTVATISATNAAGAGSNNLAITVLPSGGGGVIVTNGLLAGWNVAGQTNFGVSPLAATIRATNLITVGGLARSAGVNTNAAAADNAWGGFGWTNTNTFLSFTLSVPPGYRFSVTSLGTLDYRRSGTGPSAGLLQYSTNGSTFVTITNLNFASTDKNGASLGATPLDGVAALQNVPSGATLSLRLMITNGQSSGTWYIFDTAGTPESDLAISGVIESTNVAPSPVIAVSGSLVAASTTFGTPSAFPTSFTLSGANLAEGITVDPPAGFEVSSANTNGFAGQGNSIIVGSAGTVPNTTVFVRLAADTDVGTYSGNIVCSSVGASNAVVATAASTVSAKLISVVADFLRKTYGAEDPELTYYASESVPFSGSLMRQAGENVGAYAITQGDLTAGPNYAISFTGNNFEITRKSLSITANDITKPFGQTLSLGAGQNGFGASGLVNGETVGSVTITASGGTAAEDPEGTYTLTPSAATGGTFTPSNYSIIYNTGTLTVTGAGIPTFEQWMSTNYPQLTGGDALAAADPDKDGIANLLEYYMGLSPVADNRNAISVSFTPGSPSSLSMNYRRSKNITNVVGGVSWISTLTTNNWSTNGVSVNAVGATDYDDVTATVTNGPSDAAKFLRLRVQQQ